MDETNPTPENVDDDQVSTQEVGDTPIFDETTEVKSIDDTPGYEYEGNCGS